MIDISKENRLYERLLQKIAPGSTLIRIWPLNGGISAAMTAIEIENPAGQTERMIVRQPGEAALKANPHAARDEFQLLQVLHSRQFAAPVPYHLDETGELFPSPFLVMEFVEGKIDFAPADIDQFAAQFAVHLAQIHQIDGTDPRLAFLPNKAYECGETLQEPHTPTDPTFEEARIRAALQAALPRQRNKKVLLHGDYWPGNVLWQGRRLAAVIDWEDASLGDPLIDLAISRLDLAWIFGPDAMHAFTRYYQSYTKIDTTDLAYWDLCAALRLVRLAATDLAGWVTFFHPYDRQDITEGALLEHYHRFIMQALKNLPVEKS